MNIDTMNEETLSADGAANFFRYVEQSKNTVNRPPAFPSKPIYPNAKPIKLNPPK